MLLFIDAVFTFKVIFFSINKVYFFLINNCIYISAYKIQRSKFKKLREQIYYHYVE